LLTAVLISSYSQASFVTSYCWILFSTLIYRSFTFLVLHKSSNFSAERNRNWSLSSGFFLFRRLVILRFSIYLCSILCIYGSLFTFELLKFFFYVHGCYLQSPMVEPCDIISDNWVVLLLLQLVISSLNFSFPNQFYFFLLFLSIFPTQFPSWSLWMRIESLLPESRFMYPEIS
jgi:hypothetical protein